MASSFISSLSAGTLALSDLTVVQAIDGANQSTTGQKLFDVVGVLNSGTNPALTDKIMATWGTGTAAYTTTLESLFDTVSLLGTVTGTLTDADTVLIHNGNVAQQTEYVTLATSLYDGDSGATGWLVKGVVWGYNSTAQLGDQTGNAANTDGTSNLPYRWRGASSAGTNQVARHSANKCFCWGNNLQHATLVNLEGTISERFFAGMWDEEVHRSSATAGTWTDDGHTHLGVGISGAGFRFSTSAGDTGWMFCAGSNGNFAFYPTGVPVNVGAMQNLEFRTSGSASVSVYVDGTQVGTTYTLADANIPGSDTIIGWSTGNATLISATNEYWSVARQLTSQKFW